MKDNKQKLNNTCILINKNTFTEKQSRIIRKGKDIFILRILYILAKGDLNNEIKKKKIFFYLKTKLNLGKDITIERPLKEDIIITNYRELISFIENYCELKDINKYRVIIFNSDLHSIKGNEQLLNYKDVILYAKVVENIKKNEKEKEKNNNYKLIKNLFQIKLFPFKKIDNKENNIYTKRDIFLPRNDSFQKPNTIITSSINNHNFSKSYRNTLNKNKNSIFYIDKSQNNDYYNRIPFIKKLNKISLNYNQNTSELGNEVNKTLNDSYKIFKNSFYKNFKPEKNIIFNKLINSKINEQRERNKLNKSNPENTFYSKRNQRLKQKIFDAEKIFGNDNNSKNKAIQVMGINKSFNTKQNYLYNNFFNNIIKKQNYSCILKKQKNKNNSLFRSSNNIYASNLNNLIKIKNNKTSFNPKSLFKKTTQFSNLKTIFKYLKYPKIKSEDKNEIEKEKDSNHLSLNNLKEIYDKILYSINLIINDINDYFPDLSVFIEELDLSFMTKYQDIDINNCLKQFILYTYIDNFITEGKNISLKYLFILIDNPTNEENYKNSANLLLYLLQKIEITRQNQTFDLINYIHSKRSIEEFIISKDFFFIFVLCSNFFDKTQRDISIRILAILSIENKLHFKRFAQYYLYFKDNISLSIENKLNFITKFLYLLESGYGEEKDPKLIKKFENNVLYILKIDEKSKKFLLGNIELHKMSFLVIKKINNIFQTMVTLFSNDFTDLNQIIKLN